MTAPRPVRHPLVIDLSVAAAVVVLTAVAFAIGWGFDGHRAGHADLVGALAAVPLVVVTRWAPFAAVAGATVATVAMIGVTSERTVLFFVIAGTLYRLAARVPIRTAVLTTAATLAVYGLAVEAFAGLVADRDFDLVVWSLMATSVGVAVRERAERARRAEQSREEETRRRVVEERLRIARDLHDLVAHRIAVINVQAGVASHLVRAQPEQAEQALAIVHEAVAEVLDELGDILGVLRSADDPELPIAPTPAARDLDALVASFADAGLEVVWTSSGQLHGLPEAVQLTLYRLVQEGLTNAQRHGNGQVRLTIEATPSAVEVTLRNRTATRVHSSPGTGYGLVGMRERVLAVGGTLSAAPAESGWFEVAAQLPIPPRSHP